MGGWAERGALALLVLLACDEPRPKARPTATATGRAPTSSTPAPVDHSVRLDTPPRPAVPERRLRQKERKGEIVIEWEGKWDRDCSTYRRCKVKREELDACAPGLEAAAWSADFAAKAEHFTDPQVAIRGRLMMADGFFSTGVGCSKQACCNSRRAEIVLAGPPYDLELGLGCGGDESRVCCPLRAQGEEVIVRGELRYGAGRLYLRSPKLCLVTSAGPAPPPIVGD